MSQFKFISYTYLKRKTKLSCEKRQLFVRKSKRVSSKTSAGSIFPHKDDMIKSVVDNLAESSVLLIMGAL